MKTDVAMRRRLIIIGLVVVIVVLIGFVRFEITIVPAWSITVVDEDGSPYVGQRVDEFWADYNLELEAGHGEERWTNEHGKIDFPRRALRLSFMERGIRRTLTWLLSYMHGSQGIDVYLMTTVPDGIKTLKYEPNKPPPERWVLPRRQN